MQRRHSFSPRSDGPAADGGAGRPQLADLPRHLPRTRAARQPQHQQHAQGPRTEHPANRDPLLVV